jgi:hypothetical protein
MQKKNILIPIISLLTLISCPGAGGGGGGAAAFALFGLGGGSSSSTVTDPSIPPTETPQIQVFRDGGQITHSSTTNIGSVVISTPGTPVVFSIKNYGFQTLNLTGTPVISKTGTHPALFTITQPSEVSLAFEETVNFTIQFNPDSLGEKTAQISILSNDPSRPDLQINLTGTGTPVPTPEISVLIASVDRASNYTHSFTSVQEGLSGTDVTVTIQNQGTATLDVSNISLVSGDSSQFSITPGSLPRSISAGGSTTFTMRFNPSSTGTKTAALNILSNDADESTFVLNLSGNATAAPAPEINVVLVSGLVTIASGGSYNFPTVSATVTNATAIDFRIQNTGSASLSLTNAPTYVQITGADADQFEFVGSQPTTPITSGSFRNFSIRFRPTTEGAKTASISIANNDSNENPYTFTITGTAGPAPAPEINVRANSTDIASAGSMTSFGTIRVGYASASTTVTIQNTGNATLNLTGTPYVSIVGGNTSDFQIVSQPSANTIIGGSSLTFTVRFTPTATGARSSTFQIASNDSDEGTYTVNISGTGNEPSTSCTPTVATFTRSLNEGSQDLGGGVTLYWGSILGFGISPSAPSVVYYMNQPHSNPSGVVLSYFYNVGQDSLLQSRDSVGRTAMSGMFPYSRYSSDYLTLVGGSTIPTYTPTSSFAIIFEPNSTVSFSASNGGTNASVTTATSCNPMLLEDQAFTSAEGSSSTNGLDKVWTYRKKLNVRLIFVDGTYATPTVAGVQAAVDRMTQVYAQNSVKIDLQFSATTVTAAEFQSVANLDDDTGLVTASLTKLYTSTGSSQDAKSLNIYLTADESQVGGVLGVSSGIPGLPGVTASKKSGMILFIEPHRSSGSVGDVLSNADLVFLGNTMAHEAGHFLGLFHINERGGYNSSSPSGLNARDPIRDTPSCSSSLANSLYPNGVVDIDECLGTGFTNAGGYNLMFWAGDGVTDQGQLTGEQGWLLRNNPLTY